MVRIQVKLTLVTLLAVGAVFIIFQLYILATSRHQWEQTNKGRNKKKRKYEGWNPPPEYVTVETFTGLARVHGVPIFLLEPAILESVWAHRTKKQRAPAGGQCRFLCGGSRSSAQDGTTAFGVISNHWVHQSFLDALSRNDFKTSAFQSQDPRLLSVNELVPPSDPTPSPPPPINTNTSTATGVVPLHYFFRARNGHLIHLLVLYERAGRYLWHGPVSLGTLSQEGDGAEVSDVFRTPLDELPYCGEQASSYEKMEFADIRIDDVSLTVPKYPIKFLQQIPNAKHLECNHQQARDYRAENGRDSTAQAEEFRQRAREIVRRGAKALDKIAVPFWLSSGTCLGWYRECDIIAHSVDVDFGMKISDYSDRVIPAMESQGLQLLHLFGKKEDSFELSFARDSIKLDIFFFYEEEDFIWNGGTDVHTGEKFQYVFHLFELCWTELVGLRVRVPCPTLPYIEANYGVEWNQRVTEWDWKESPPNVRPNGKWPPEELPYVIQTFPIM